jgi:hypothetical protein
MIRAIKIARCNRAMSEVDQMSYYAYYVDYGYYKIDQNNQSKITVHETDILNFHLMEHFY